MASTLRLVHLRSLTRASHLDGTGRRCERTDHLGEALVHGRELSDLSASLFNKLLSFTAGMSFAPAENASEVQNGIEAWRLLGRRSNLATPQNVSS